MVLSSRWLRFGPALAGLLVTCGCRPVPPVGDAPAPSTPPGEQPQALVIGAAFPLSATGAGRIGQMKRQGADVAVEHLNAAGGINGRPLRIEYADTRNNTTEALNAFNLLVDVKGAPVVMSAMSQVSLSLVGPADRKQVVLFANASHPDLAKKSPFVFRNMPSTAQNAKAIAEAAYRDLGLRRVAVLHVNDEYGAEAARVFDATFAALGGQISGVDSFDVAGTDMRSQIVKLAEAEPDAFWLPGFGQSLALVLKQMQELQVPAVRLADLGLVDSKVLETAGAAADRVIVVAPAFDPADPAPKVAKFVADYQAKYSEEPSFDAAFQYDAVFLIADAMRRATALTGPAIREALAATSGFEGVCGPTSFDPNGEAQMPVVVRMMVDHRLQPVERLAPAGAAPATTDTTPTDASGQE